ncbi:MAG: hypothetical protein AB7W16_16075 [Candidatus Obscuribacterales bacterium]
MPLASDSLTFTDNHAGERSSEEALRRLSDHLAVAFAEITEI